MEIKIALRDITETYNVTIKGEEDAGEYRVEGAPLQPRDRRYRIMFLKETRWLDERSRPFATITRAIEQEKQKEHLNLIEKQRRVIELARTSSGIAHKSSGKKYLPAPGKAAPKSKVPSKPSRKTARVRR
jgi:hypothetical protein